MRTDKMYIRDWELKCVIGTRPEERRRRQAVRLNVTLECDLSRAGMSDRLADTLNYVTLQEEIATWVGRSRCFLIERLAQGVADICLRADRVAAVVVVVDKPAALPEARSVAVEIRRRRSRGVARRAKGRRRM